MTTHSKIKEEIDDGTMGTVISIFGRRNATIEIARRLASRVRIEEFLAAHDLDLILWYLDDKVDRVTSEIVIGPVQEEYGTHDICWIMVKTRRGAVGVVSSNGAHGRSLLGSDRQPRDGVRQCVAHSVVSLH